MWIVCVVCVAYAGCVVCAGCAGCVAYIICAVCVVVSCAPFVLDLSCMCCTASLHWWRAVLTLRNPRPPLFLPLLCLRNRTRLRNAAELDISDSQMDIPLPRLRFAEPAGGNPGSPYSRTDARCSRYPKGKDCGGGSVGVGSRSGPLTPPPLPRRTIIPASNRASANASALPGGRHTDEEGGGGFDAPRFSLTLKTLTAVKTRLWNRWDLSTFPRLTALEVSFAGKTALEQLHRKVRGGGRGEGVAAKLGCADISVLMVGGLRAS